MSNRSEWPRFARAEIRDFADWLDSQGWEYERTDTNGHIWWTHPATGAVFSLPSTPRTFHVRRARVRVLRLMGQTPQGKRKGTGERKRSKAAREREQQQRERKNAAERARILEQKDARAREGIGRVAAAMTRDQERAVLASEQRRRDIEGLMSHG